MTTQNNLTNLSDLSNAQKKAPGKRRGKHSGKRADHEGSIYYWKTKKLWVASIRLGQNPKTGKEIRPYPTGSLGTSGGPAGKIHRCHTG